MVDGHLNKCKDCTKRDVRDNYDKKILNDEWVNKERIRSREKYHRLRYKDKYPVAHSGITHVRKYISRRLNIPIDCEVHHWDYNRPYDVFILNRRAHKIIHQRISFDKDSQKFLYKGELLDTKEKHKAMIKEVFELRGVSYKIIEENIS